MAAEIAKLPFPFLDNTTSDVMNGIFVHTATMVNPITYQEYFSSINVERLIFFINMVFGNVMSLQYFFIHTSGGIPIVTPTMLVHHTTKYESTCIQMMLPTKVQIKNLTPIM